MGIDIHIGDWSIAFHVHTPVLVVLGAIALYFAVKLAGYVLAVTGIGPT
jgi:hypothetical protein